MSHSINGTTISLTRGDSFSCSVKIYSSGGKSIYTPNENDKIKFTVKTGYDEDDEVLIRKNISPTDLTLSINPQDTKSLNYGTYVYDIELTTADGRVDTFITKAKLKITEEVG